MSSTNPYELPADLPVPIDDGACNHLPGLRLPSIALMSTTGQMVDPSKLQGRVVVYCYPRTGRPGQEIPEGWDNIPGARGCTPQSCAFRDHHAELVALGARLFGLSTQTTDYQQTLSLARALRLPTFESEWAFGAQPETLIKRLTLILDGGRIEKVFYPVFPPDKNAEQVRAWLSEPRNRVIA